jgi:hypothetical protein
MTFLVSCGGKEGCTDFGSENYDPDAIVNDGSCIQVFDKFVGTFIVDADCMDYFYQIRVDETSDDYVVRIHGLADTTSNLEANISGLNINIRQQKLYHHVTIEGAGVSIDGGISLSYHIKDSRTGNVVLQDCLQWCSRL